MWCSTMLCSGTWRSCQQFDQLGAGRQRLGGSSPLKAPFHIDVCGLTVETGVSKNRWIF